MPLVVLEGRVVMMILIRFGDIHTTMMIYNDDGDKIDTMMMMYNDDSDTIDATMMIYI